MVRWAWAGVWVGVLGLSVGCDPSPPPPRVPVPAAGTLGPPRGDPVKPLPAQAATAGQRPSGGVDGGFVDPPLVRDRPPEQRAFVSAYNQVGRPRIAVFVNRRLDGSVIGHVDSEVAAGATAVPAMPTTQPVVLAGPDGRAAGSVTGAVVSGVYDESFARAMDYEAVEAVLTDWLAAGGNTEIISPALARARLTQGQRDALERGERGVLLDVTERLDADILVQVQARPTRQTVRGVEVRLVAEAINTRGGRSIGRAVVDVPPPLDKPRIESSTRLVARKLMDDMVQAWTAPIPGSAPPPGQSPPPPGQSPPPPGQ
ncbi:MAG: hypothetical protein ACK4PI_05570 [Tepidisphaerales bacterium]